MIPLRDSQPSHSVPIVTILLIVTNTVVFFYELSLDEFSRNHLIATYGAVPARLEYHTLVTSMFLHGGWLHFIGNMWFLWIFGDNLEDILGRLRYLAFYLLAGIAAALAHVALNPDSHLPAIGASGAIAGVMGAYLMKFPHSRVLTLVPIFFFVMFYELPASVVLGFWLIIQIFSGIGSIAFSQASAGGVAWFAHIGGFVAGMILITLMRTRERYPHRRDLHW